MPLRIKTGLTNIEIQVEQEESDKLLFNLVQLETTIDYPLEIINNHFEDIEGYDIHLFKNRFGNLERGIFQISIKQGSIAWMLPLSIYDNNIFDFRSEISEALPSDNAQKLKTHNLFLNCVAYPAFHKLLLAELIPSKIAEQNQNYNLLDFYDDETNVLIISRTELRRLKIDFDLSLYLPSLYKYGYVLLDSEKDFYDIQVDKSSKNLLLKDKTTFDTIKIHSVADTLIHEIYVIELFKNVLKMKLHPLVRFHFLYQVIELLINKIGIEHYKRELQKKINVDSIISYLHNFNNLISGNFHSVNEIKGASGEISKIYDSLSKVPNEEDRIEMLFNHSIKNDTYKKLLYCSKKITNMDSGKLNENIYKVRNALVHSYHDLYNKDKTIDEKIQDINAEFETLIIDILVQYSYK